MARKPTDEPPKIDRLTVDELRPNPRNANKHPEEQILRLMAALRSVGQTRPVLARLANNMLIAGHGVHTAARRLQWNGIDVIRLDVDQATADRIMLSDDRLGTLSELDQRRTADLLRDISEGDWLATGYSVEEAARIFDSKEVAELPVEEIETSTVTDDFWVSVRGPLPMQAAILQRMKTLLGEYPDVRINVDTVEDA